MIATTIQSGLLADQVQEIAHTYHLYRNALAAANYAGISIYGDWLISMQSRMGVELIAPQAIRAAIATADQKIDAFIFEADDDVL